VTEQHSRAHRIAESVEAVIATFQGAGTDVHDADSRERFAAEHRWLRGLRHWINGTIAAVGAAALTGLGTVIVPWLIRALTWPAAK
jgi:fatty acid desaturase